MIYFHYYPAKVESKKPLGMVSLFDFLRANQDPNPKIREIFKQIAAAELSGDKALKARLKQENLYYFTPCVVFDGLGRSYTNIVQFTGLLVLDFDHIDHAPEFKYWLFETYDCVIAAWLSPSKKGVKALVKIPVVDSIDHFKALFYGMGNEMEKLKGFDGSGQNCVLPLFLSIDPDLLYRDDATTWEKKGIKINDFKVSDAPTIIVDINDSDKAKVQEIIITLVNRISDNGHPQIRAAAVTLGGYVCTGYISQAEAESFIYSLIENNAYLRKGVSGYKKTAKTAIQEGTKSQLLLKRNPIEF